VKRTVQRVGLFATAVLATIVVAASPAAARTEIDLNPAQAGATNAVMTVNAEAESASAGITTVRMVLPPGITPAQITLSSGPAGWKLNPTGDGFTVEGSKLPTRTSAKFTITIAQLPATAGVLTFKTIVTYSDGKADRWIGAPSESNPAPTVSLRPAAVASTQPSASPSAAQPSPPTAAAAAASVTPLTASDSPGSGYWPIIIGALVLVVLGAIGWFALRSRRRASAQ
jgi:hypothetical protein